MLSTQHLVLNREAGIAAELIASGVTLLGRANYAHNGLYGQAFFNLSIGFERAGKLIYIADHAIEHGGVFPTNEELKQHIGHDLDRLFKYADAVAARRRSGKKHSMRPATHIHDGIVRTLTEFAKKTRYYNLDVVTQGSKTSATSDPMKVWEERVIRPVIEEHCSAKKRAQIEANARDMEALLSDRALVHYTDEAGNTLNTVFAATHRTGETDVARKWVPLYVLQLTRWMAYLLYDLSHVGAYEKSIDALRGLDEHFAIFRNEDHLLKGRRTWSIYRP